MMVGVGRSVRQHEHRPRPLPSVDPLIAVDLANSDVVPAATAEDRSGAAQHLVSDGAALHIDVAGALPASLHWATTQSIESSCPAMKPSNDIVTCQITLLTETVLSMAAPRAGEAGLRSTGLWSVRLSGAATGRGARG